MPDVREATVPDIGDFTDVPVIEVLVKPGDSVEKDQGLVTLESAKATMEVPAPFAGTVREVKVKENDTVSQGSVIALIEAGDEQAASKPAAPAEKPVAGESPPKKSSSPQRAEGRVEEAEPKVSAEKAKAAPTPESGQPEQRDESGPRSPPIPFDADTIAPDKVPYASPAVRAFARELGADLARVRGSADRKSVV